MLVLQETRELQDLRVQTDSPEVQVDQVLRALSVSLVQLEARVTQVPRVRRVNKDRPDSPALQGRPGALDLPVIPELRATRAPLVPRELPELLDRTATRELLVSQELKGNKDQPGLQALRVTWVQMDLRGHLEIQGSRASLVQRDLRVILERLEIQVRPDHRVSKVPVALMDHPDSLDFPGILEPPGHRVHLDLKDLREL